MARLTPRLLASAVISAALALPGSAWAQTSISGTPIDVYNSGTGRLQVYFLGGISGSASDFHHNFDFQTDGHAGINVAVYNPAETEATVYGFRGTPFRHVSGPTRSPLTGGGSADNPWFLTTTYETPACPADPCLRVTETARYVNGERAFRLGYRVLNNGSVAQKFRVTAGGDVRPGNDAGIPLQEAGPPEALGTQNPFHGQAMQIQAITPWDHWMEAEPFEIWRRVQRPVTSGLADTTDTVAKDKAVAVEWNTHKSSALAAGGEASYELFWRFKDWDALALSTPPALPTFTEVDVTATGLDHASLPGAPDFTDFDVDKLHYRINTPIQTGTYAEAPAQTTTGHTDFSWIGQTAGAGSIEAFVDINDNGVKDPHEAYASRNVTWFDRLRIASSTNNLYAGIDAASNTVRQATATIEIRNQSNAAQPNTDYEWSVTGANPVSGTGTALTGDQLISWSVPNPGTDTLVVRADINDDGDFTDDGETRAKVFTWLPRLTSSPESATYIAHATNTQTLSLKLRSFTGSNVTSTPVRYKVTGAGGAADVASGTRTTDGSGNFSIALVGPTVGRDVVLAWHDMNNNGTWNLGEPRVDVPVEWVLSPDHRFTLSHAGDPHVLGNDPATDEEIAGTSTTVNVHLVDAYGAADGETIRWDVVGVNPSPEAELETDGAGNVSIPVDDGSPSGGHDEVEVYADYNDNDRRDANEPFAEADIEWKPPVEVLASSSDRVPSDTTASVVLRDAQGERLETSFTWALTGGSANAPQSGGGSTSPRTTFGGGVASITWNGTNVGTDTIVVSANTDGASGMETGQKTLEWLPQLQLFRSAATRVPGQTASIDAFAHNTSNANREFFYEITSDNGAATIADSVVSDAGGTIPDIEWSRVTAGTDTIEVWTETNGMPGEQAGDAHETTTVQWLAPQLTLKIAAGTNPDTQHASVGATATATATLLNPVTGAPALNVPMRWTRGSKNSVMPGKNVVETNGAGQVVLPWTGTLTGQDCVTLYPDFDLDGARDSDSEPSATRCVEFHPRVEASSTSASVRLGVQRSVTVTFRDDDFSPLDGETLNWRIAGANPGAGTLVTDGAGQVTRSWTSETTGTDTLEVWLDNVVANGAPDAGEYKAVSTTTWLPRLTLNKSACPNPPAADVCQTVTLATSTSTTAIASYWNAAGSLQNGTPLRYRVDGVNETQTPVAITSGTAFTLNGTVAGDDLVTVWQDSTADGEPGAGEFKTTFLLTWKNSIQLLPGNPADQYHGGGRDQTFEIKLSSTTVPKVCYAVTGANPQADSIAPAATTSAQLLFTLEGQRPGSDYVLAWIEDDATCARDGSDPDEAASATWMHWTRLLTLGNPVGTPTAGTPATVRATLRDATTPATFHAGGSLMYRIEGANAVGATPAAGTTNGFGQLDLQLTGSSTGSSHLFVWQDLAGGAAGVRDPGEPEAELFFSWAAPPVTLTLSQTTGTHFEDNVHTVTATLAGVPGGNAGYVVHWSVAGANAGKSGTSPATDGGGVTTFSYTGTEPGDDTITAYAEVSGSGSTRDGYDPQDTESVHWDPLLAITGGGGSNATGLPQSVTVTLRDTSGNPLVDREVWFEISGANPTAGIQTQARTAAIARVAGGSVRSARTNGSGQTTVTWTGYNPGTDTLDVYGDSDNNGTRDPSDARARTTVSWAGAAVAPPGTGSGTGTGTGSGPTGSAAQVPPESDFDGLPTPPAPVTGRAVNIEPVSGKVLVRLPGSSRFINLLDAEQVPVGTVVDVRAGRVELTSTKDNRGGIQSAEFFKGMFRIGQQRAAKPVTDLALFGGNFKGCGKPARGGAPHGSAAANKKRVVRRLWGSGKGQFRTRGRYAAAALRGTDWETQDRCDGTLVRVTKGLVAVTDLVRRRTVIVRARRQYFAAARR